MVVALNKAFRTDDGGLFETEREANRHEAEVWCKQDLHRIAVKIRELGPEMMTPKALVDALWTHKDVLNRCFEAYRAKIHEG